ncbi:hypothetical protein H0H93_016606 [Arthromyces matolae]|nr:hypothetical protein H0H93_016606 [Arthromyces matolae]
MFFLARKAYKKYNASSAAKAKLADPETEAAEPSSGNDSRLAEFLTTSKEKYLNDIRATPSKGNEWVVVMGNEAGDLDSVASSIAYAWFRSKEYNEKAIPLLQLNRSDLDLRAENTYALSLAGITQPKEQLLFLDDIPSFSLTNPTTPFPSCTFSLVDHNTLGSAYTFNNPAANVNAVLDHHADEGHHLNASPRIISSCGSCTSHVASLFFSLPEAEFPATLATLLLTGILIDTNGLKPGGKAENTDHTAAGFLAPRSTLAPSLPQNLIASLTTDPSAQPDALHDTSAIKGLTKKLREIKEDVSHLSARDLLRRDRRTQIFARIITENWIWDPQELLALNGFIKQFEEFTETRDLTQPDDAHLVLECSREDQKLWCGYYYASASTRSVFWLETFDISNFLDGAKAEPYPIHVDAISSTETTVNYTTKDLKEMAGIVKNASSGCKIKTTFYVDRAKVNCKFQLLEIDTTTSTDNMVPGSTGLNQSLELSNGNDPGS